MDILKDVPIWALLIVISVLIVAVGVLWGFFLWSIKNTLTDIKGQLQKLFDKDDVKQLQISALEKDLAALRAECHQRHLKDI